ncbi:MAG: hypothetical protein V4617_20090 [Gemmatimonadota bacterium]
MLDTLPDPPAAAAEGARPARLLLLLVGLITVVLTTSTAASVYVAGDSARRDAARRLPMVAMSMGVRASVQDVAALLDSLAPSPVAGGPPAVGTEQVALDVALDATTSVTVRVAASVARADSALLVGNVRRAAEEARALLADSRSLLGQPGADAMADGWTMVQQGARLLVRAAQQGEEPLLAGAARRLEAVGRSAYTLTADERRAFERLGETPEDGRLLQIVRDPTRPFALRTDAAAGALLRGACMNPREVMFGISDARDEAFAVIVATLDSATAVSGGTVAVATRIRLMRDAFHGSVGQSGAGRVQEDWLALHLVPAPVRTRARFCRTI